ncbi:hypothetical protein CEXT_86581 [Caerostris extrusa]|uniref:Secreted protein n=1 Tax=Caerostris extrusa TaxID=172846 RepID=A0AAV4N594_CAEEX|nr:hypothetical protein CEXT_86581 [Caerostris extrusa]
MSYLTLWLFTGLVNVSTSLRRYPVAPGVTLQPCVQLLACLQRSRLNVSKNRISCNISVVGCSASIYSLDPHREIGNSSQLPLAAVLHMIIT